MASQIRFEPNGVDGLVASGTSIAAAAERLGVAMELQCGGAGECTSCAVRIADGPFTLSPLTDAERRVLSEAEVGASLRLGCQARVGDSDCTVHVLEAAERPPMPSGSACAERKGEESGGERPGGSASKGGWFGFDPFGGSKSGESGDEAAAAGERERDSAAGSAGEGSRAADEVRQRILDAFGELPASERLAAAFEINMKAATDFFGAVLDGPLKAGEEALESLMKQAASVVRETRKRDSDTAGPSESSTDSASAQESDRP